MTMTPRHNLIRALALLCLLTGAVRICRAQESQPTTSAPSDPIRVMWPGMARSVNDFRASLTEGAPGLRGFRAPILMESEHEWRPDLSDKLAPELKICADIVARRLARDGLLPTLAQIVQVLGRKRVTVEGEGMIALLQSIGFPVDLLVCFPEGDAEAGDAFRLIVDVARIVTADDTTPTAIDELRKRPFRWKKTRKDFYVITDTGEHEIEDLRLQIAGGKYYQGVGDGGSIDVARQLVEQLPDAAFVASIDEANLEPFVAIAREWPLGRPGRLTVIGEPLPVSQWAQDNAKVGFASSPEDPSMRPTLLVPRYASRREEMSVFVPGESFLFDAVAAQGLPVIHSPLLFQGGNLIAIRLPEKGRRLLLIGEAEVYRNIALGLSSNQVLEAFRSEFGVDECVILPAISYHIDYEMSVRATPSGVVVFVNDELAACGEVLKAGLHVLETQKLVDHQAAEKSWQELGAGKAGLVLDVCEKALEGNSVDYGRFPLSFASHFAVGPSDSGVGNLQRFLLAMDIAAFAPSKSPWQAPEPHGEAYGRSLRRRADERNQLRAQLKGLGWRVATIPSWSDGDRSLNYLNGIHTPGSYIMPAYGGLYSELDQAAATAFQRELGTNVKIVKILCGESQSRHGGVRCSVNVIPRIE